MDFLIVTQPLDDKTGASILFYNYEKSHPGSRMLMVFIDDEQQEQLDANGGFDIDVVLRQLLRTENYVDSNTYTIKRTDWASNDSTLGAWEQWQFGSTYEDWYDAAGPLGNLHLAGSAHCLEYWGFTWGAMINGIYNGEFVVNRILYPTESLDYQEPYSPCDTDSSFKTEFGRFYEANGHFFEPK